MRESQNIEWKETWRDEYLTPQHSSCPFNPLIANAFFRVGEIEAWGRGIQRITATCKEAGLPKPTVSYDPSDLWFEFPFSQEYLRIVANPTPHPQTTPGDFSNTTQKTTQELIIRLMMSQPSITRRELAQKIGLTTDGIKYHLDQMRRRGRIQHVGPTKSGHWEVLP